MINEKENAVLLIAGFTQREINTQKKKFYNLFRVEPWLVPMRKIGEWEGLTGNDIDDIAAKLDDTTIGWSTHEFARAIQAKLMEKNA